MREIIQHPDPMLRQVSKPVKKIDDKVKEIASELVHYANTPGCVGLSAIQLGEPIRLFAAKRGNEDIVMVNSKVLKLSKQVYRVPEGCTSVDYGKSRYLIVRHKSIKITGLGLNGNRITFKAWGLFGEILQHESDHLEGMLVLDRGERV